MPKRRTSKRRVLTVDDITAILKELGPGAERAEIRGAMWINRGKESIRWAGAKDADANRIAQTIIAFKTLFPDSPNTSTPKPPLDPAEMYRVRREVLEKAEAEHAEDVIAWKGLYKAPRISAAAFCSGAWLDICGYDMRHIKQAIIELLQEGKIPAKRTVPLESARWGLDRRWCRKNVHALGKKYGMDLRAHTTQRGVVIERVE